VSPRLFTLGLSPTKLLGLYEIFGGQDETLDSPIRRESVHDFGNVGERHAAIIVMIGFDGDARPRPTRVEAARRASAHVDGGKATLLEHVFQLRVNLDGAARGARPFGGAIGTAIHAHEQKSFPERQDRTRNASARPPSRR